LASTDPSSAASTYRLWVNDDRTLLIRVWDDGTIQAATRDKDAFQDSVLWGPPQILTEEKT
jgi:hypothetical protein